MYVRMRTHEHPYEPVQCGSFLFRINKKIFGSFDLHIFIVYYNIYYSYYKGISNEENRYI